MSSIPDEAVRDTPITYVDCPTELMPVEPMPDPRDDAMIGTDDAIIGAYKLLQKIGEGGMGVVYMAEQTRPVVRRVALKVVKPGMDSRAILARFEAERQALALMDHPSIARVLDAGATEQGRPYFVMELVGGIPITKCCDQRQLSLRERLELFIPVCHAVQHAHQKGIIHRDLKPSNVLIAEYDNHLVPKIIDFGLAKAIGQRLTERTAFTQFGQIVGTIDYMSPEQASFNQLDVDTRSDVYSLGVLLYELLAGERPFDRQRLHTAALDELLRIIRQEDPPRPSARLSSHASLPKIAADRRSEPKKLSLMVRGELDWIVMKAMDKDRDRRYQSPSELADDIRRFLQHEAVLACPPTAGYRFRKFARRNRALMASAATVSLALLLGLATTSWALVQAKHELRQKEAAFGQLYWANLHGEHRVDQYFRLEQAACRLTERLAAQISRDPQRNALEAQSLQSKLLAETIAFWDELIAADRDSSGSSDWRIDYYRLQRALCLARSGDHQAAFHEAQALRNDLADTAQSRRDLVRLYGLCAAAAQDNPELLERYVDAGIEQMRVAAETAADGPLSADDPDLAAFASHPEFQPILDGWGERHRRKGRIPSEPSLLGASPINSGADHGPPD